jgi:hypothetical protein
MVDGMADGTASSGFSTFLTAFLVLPPENGLK